MKKIEIFKMMEEHDFEQVVFFQDKKTGLKGITAIHDSKRGPALGGTRLWKYDSEDEAIEDVMRLARGMSYKNAVANLKFGGGKTVLMGTPDMKSKEFMEMLGNYVETLNGRYITAEDININTDDCAIINSKTDSVTGLGHKSGNPSPFTAWGVFHSLMASAKRYLDKPLSETTVSVQGVGQTGYYLVKFLMGYTIMDIVNKTGPSVDPLVKEVIFTEINKDHIARMNKEHPEVKFVKPEDIIKAEVDIFAPCALGKVINEKSIKDLKCKIVCGSANNVLETPEDGARMKKAGIIYCPDYVVNAAGVINVYSEFTGQSREKTIKQIEDIATTLNKVFDISEKEDITTNEAADRLGDQMMQEGKRKSSPRAMFIPSKE